MNICDEFNVKEARMAELCVLIANAHRMTPYPHTRSVADDLRRIASELCTNPDLERKRQLAIRVKGHFHKDSVFESPPDGVTWNEWQNLGNELYDLTWIYQESKYSHVRE